MQEFVILSVVFAVCICHRCKKMVVAFFEYVVWERIPRESVVHSIIQRARLRWPGKPAKTKKNADPKSLADTR